MSLSHEDVVRIIQILDTSHFDELSLEAEGVKLNIRRNSAASSSSSIRSTPSVLVNLTDKTVAASQVPLPVVYSAAVSEDLLEIKASMLGTFYGAPKPGANPFVSVGSRITKETVIGIIEVMKLMNSVSAGVEGTVVETLVSDGNLVEFDQVLMRVRQA